MFAALLPLVLGLAPQLAGMIFGSKGGETAAKVTEVVQAVVGIDPTTDEGATRAVEAIRGNAALRAELEQKLGELHLRMQQEANRAAEQERADALEELRARLGDTASARGMALEAAKSNSVLAYGSMILSGVILVGFSTMLYIVLNTKLENPELANVLLGTLAAMATQVANYWLGSSSGSVAKNAALAGVQTTLANSVPASFVRGIGGTRPPATPPAPAE